MLTIIVVIIIAIFAVAGLLGIFGIGLAAVTSVIALIVSFLQAMITPQGIKAMLFFVVMLCLFWMFSATQENSSSRGYRQEHRQTYYSDDTQPSVSPDEDAYNAEYYYEDEDDEDLPELKHVPEPTTVAELDDEPVAELDDGPEGLRTYQEFEDKYGPPDSTTPGIRYTRCKWGNRSYDFDSLGRLIKDGVSASY